ncbi:MAG: Holliday junction resolvase RuvX [Gemmatimonadetes bacterium]|nr:Holliday junction resolvase RuvX [Gemmatimonadota bacterium]
MRRILAIDYGERRIGVALSDPTATIAQPLATLTRRAGKRAPIQAILELCQQHEVSSIVVGLPLTLAGEDSDWTRSVRDFAARLEQRSALPVTLVDERLSSVAATRAVRAIGLRRQARAQRERVDAGAAALILQWYLDRQPRSSP